MSFVPYILFSLVYGLLQIIWSLLAVRIKTCTICFYPRYFIFKWLKYLHIHAQVCETYFPPHLLKLAFSMQWNKKSNALHEMSFTLSVIHTCTVQTHILMTHVRSNCYCVSVKSCCSFSQLIPNGYISVQPFCSIESNTIYVTAQWIIGIWSGVGGGSRRRL